MKQGPESPDSARVEHGYPEWGFDAGEVTLSYATIGSTDRTALRGVHSARWAFAADAGAGVELGIVRRRDVVLEAHALVAPPYPVVRLVETEAARGARPALLGSLRLVGWL
ncbi:hypothetical protein [Sorangium sp. So ce363]|uniref:hypothetical protein n=1 Tax=Sorangium sp. So ce363 TaxID=3133304 RepID=UPI003F618C55